MAIARRKCGYEFSSNYLYLYRLKKTLAILLLSIYLFNFAGYSFVFQYLMDRSDSRILHTIESESYNKSEVMVLKTPLHLAYYNGNTEFERVNGEVEINGTHYTYIQRKVTNDTLYVVCLLNQEKTALHQSKNSFAKEAASLPADNKKETGPNNKKAPLGSEYPQVQCTYSFTAFDHLSARNRTAFFQKLAPGTISTPYTPPDFI